MNAVPDNAVEWLKELRSAGRITADNHEGRMRWMRKASKIDYQQNSARISFASYHVALHEDPAKTSLLLGHQNPSLLWETYRALVSKEEAKRYWRITPTYDGEGEVTRRLSEAEMMRTHAKMIAEALAED